MWSISSEQTPSTRAHGLRPARALRSGAARGRYNAAWLTLSLQHSVWHVPRAAAANGTVWIAVLRKLIFGRYGVGDGGGRALRSGAARGRYSACAREYFA